MKLQDTEISFKFYTCPKCGKKMPDASKDLHPKYCKDKKSQEDERENRIQEDRPS